MTIERTLSKTTFARKWNVISILSWSIWLEKTRQRLPFHQMLRALATKSWKSRRRSLGQATTNRKDPLIRLATDRQPKFNSKRLDLRRLLPVQRLLELCSLESQGREAVLDFPKKLDNRQQGEEKKVLADRWIRKRPDPATILKKTLSRGSKEVITSILANRDTKLLPKTVAKNGKTFQKSVSRYPKFKIIFHL